jgi:hypothetical protein
MCPVQDANAADSGCESGPASPPSGLDCGVLVQLLQMHAQTLQMLNTLCAQNAMLIELLASGDPEDDDQPASTYLDGRPKGLS